VGQYRQGCIPRFMESAPFRGLAPLTDFFDCQVALPFLRARSSVETLTPDCWAACSKVIPCLIRDKPLFTIRGVALGRPRRLLLARALARPERTRSRISSLSNSATAESKCARIRPTGVLMSIWPVLSQ
jgi:hypothetical protein